MPAYDLDRCYAAFCAELPPHLREVGRTLAHQLKLVPHADIPWSATFKHPVTLGAPALLVEAMPTVSDDLVREAVTAHLLAVIEAFGTDRVCDGQVEGSADLLAVLSSARRHRDDRLEGLDGARAIRLARAADQRTLEAIDEERRLFHAARPVDLSVYLSVSAGKQAVGLPASLALARRAGFSAHDRKCLEDLLMSIWLGLQVRDDVADWEDDLGHGGAWALLLAGGADPDGELPLSDARRRVLQSGVLALMMDQAVAYFRTARQSARTLGAHTLEAWAATRESEAAEIQASERAHPGYLRRANRLDAWMREVCG